MPISGPPPINPGEETTDVVNQQTSTSSSSDIIRSDTVWNRVPPAIPNRDQDFFNKDLIGQISDLKLQVAQLKLKLTLTSERVVDLENQLQNQDKRNYNLEAIYQ
jgi:uncharacterized protein involved in exopolysaccharide biosynthesis